MPEKKQETFKQLHQEKQHTKRARKSAGQNIRDLNRKAATVLWKICASILLSNFNLQHMFVFLAVQDSSIGDLVTHSLTHSLSD